jgi:glycosyltransferase involved in cell wall biosynthesis
MPAEQITAFGDGPARDEIPALYARLQEEILRTDVTATRPLVRRPGVRGALVYAAKKLLKPEARASHDRHVRELRQSRRGAEGRVAYYSPMPPERSGIADYSALLVPALERLVDVEVAPRGKHADGDVALYHVGNDPEVHGWILERLRREPGIVVLHDFVLHHLVASLTLGRKDNAGYLAAMERDSGVAGRLLGLGVIDGCVPPLWELRAEDFPLCDEVLERATGVVVHSRYVEERVRGRGYDRPVWRIPMPAWPAPEVRPERLSGEPVFGAFGHLNASKRIPQLLEAFADYHESHPGSRLLLVGAVAAGSDATRQIKQSGLADAVVREGYVEEERLWSLIAGVDAVISLRSPTMGETSGTVIRALSLGKPLLVSDVGWFAELPDDVALKVAPDDGEVERLALALETLSDPAERERRRGRARELAAEHDVERVAELYASALQEAAGGIRALSNAQR